MRGQGSPPITPTTARIAEWVGHEKLSTTSDVYTHVLGDRREADYAELLAA